CRSTTLIILNKTTTTKTIDKMDNVPVDVQDVLFRNAIEIMFSISTKPGKIQTKLLNDDINFASAASRDNISIILPSSLLNIHL
ncbi:MAG: hypothetical protein ACW99F_17720, partial [Candidatus Hodarchaeales archaeon]